nr:MAG TPA: hypothetical protein [Caudoviricetes sp.]
MSRKRIYERPPAPTDEEVLSYDNVPIAVAARYIGMPEASLRLALREERARHLGFAVQGTGHLIYNISPGGLVRYKRQGGEIIPFEHLQDVLVSTIIKEVERRIPAAQ